jgi:hypothetical protein
LSRDQQSHCPATLITRVSRRADNWCFWQTGCIYILKYLRRVPSRRATWLGRCDNIAGSLHSHDSTLPGNADRAPPSIPLPIPKSTSISYKFDLKQLCFQPAEFSGPTKKSRPAHLPPHPHARNKPHPQAPHRTTPRDSRPSTCDIPSLISDHVVTAPDGHRSSILLPTKVARKGVSVGGSRNISKLHQLNSYFRNPAVRISKAPTVRISSHPHLIFLCSSPPPRINPKLITPLRS